MVILTQILEKARQAIEKNCNNFLETGNLETLCENTQEQVLALGRDVVRATLEELDAKLIADEERKKNWNILRTEKKQILTSLGTVSFKKTIVRDKATKKQACSLLDKKVGLTAHQKTTDEVVTRIAEAAVLNSYEYAGSRAVLNGETLSRQTAMNKVRGIVIPDQTAIDDSKQIEKKKVDYLHIDADEDHASLQFYSKKGDLQRQGCYKRNTLITKLVYVYEGIDTTENRHELINPHYFAGTYQGEKQYDLWDEVYAYMDTHYDLDHVKAIYLHSDGGSWITSVTEYIPGLIHVLDSFHLHKYLTQATTQFGKYRHSLKEHLLDLIKCGKKSEYQACMDSLGKAKNLTENGKYQIDRCKAYILNHWQAARRSLSDDDSICSCTAESHVRSVLSDRMSTKPMGWCKKGADQMAHLRAYYINGNAMSKLIHWQKERNIVKQAVGAETTSLPVRKVKPGDRYVDQINVHPLPAVMQNTSFRKLCHGDSEEFFS